MKTVRVYTFNGGINTVLDPTILGESQAQELHNFGIQSCKMVPLKENQRTDIDLEPLGCYVNNERSVVKWYGRYYWSENRLVDPRYGGNEEDFIGIPEAPIANVSSGTTDGITGTFKYAITYFTENQFEGSPQIGGEWWNEIELTNQKGIVTAPDTFPDHVAGVKVYRTIDEGLDFYLIGEIDTPGGTFTDTVTDADLVFNLPLTTVGWLPPPAGGRYLTESTGVFFVAVNDKLYFSVQGEIHAWKPSSMIQLSDAITGIAKEFSGILVFTKNKTYRFVGVDSPDTISQYEIPSTQGCKNWRTISSMANYPIWLSFDGICMWDGSNIRVVSMGIVDTTMLFNTHAVTYDNCYYLFHRNGALVYDMKNGGIFRTTSDTCDYAWSYENAELLYLVFENELSKDVFVFNASSIPRNSRYKSPRLLGSTCVLKRWNRIAIQADKATIHVLANKPYEIQHKGGRGRYYLPYGFINESIEVTVRSPGSVSEIVVEYEEKGL